VLRLSILTREFRRKTKKKELKIKTAPTRVCPTHAVQRRSPPYTPSSQTEKGPKGKVSRAHPSFSWSGQKREKKKSHPLGKGIVEKKTNPRDTRGR